jgi:cobalamin biosynthesis protein CobT
MLAWQSDNMGDYFSNAPLYTEKFEKYLDAEAKGWLKKLRAGTYYDRMKKLRDDLSMKRTDKAYQISRDIYEQIFDLDADKEEERCKAMQEAEGKGRGKDDGEGKGKDKGKGAARKGVQGKGEKGESEEFYEYDYRPFAHDQHDEFISGETVHKGCHVNYEGYKPSGHHSYAPTPFRDTIVVDYPAMTSNFSRITPSESGHSSRMDYYSKEVGNDHTGEGFANKVRMLLQIRSKGKTQYGTKHGKLHPANTYRVIIPDAPGYNQRVFKKKIETDILDTAVFILGDVSGSMSGHKHAHQIGAFALMNASIGNALRIPIMMAGFTEHSCRNAMFIWRKFDNIALSRDKLVQRMMHTSNYMNENADGDAILWAYHTLKQRKEKRKVLIVTSDGSPASSKGGDIYSFTKETIQKIEKDKSVDIVAVGIMDTNVTKLYKQHHVIKKADEIEQALLSIIERKII